MTAIKRCSMACVVLFLALPLLGQGGTFTYNPGSWSNFTGTGAGDPTSYIANVDSGGLTPTLTLTSTTSSQNYTLGGSYSYTVTWTPASGSDPVPTSVTVTLNAQACLSAFGTGVASITQNQSQLIEMDSTNNPLAGFTTPLYQTTATLPIVKQQDGTYLASGSFTTDTLSSTWNSGSGGNTSCEESFTLYSMIGNFS